MTGQSIAVDTYRSPLKRRGLFSGAKSPANHDLELRMKCKQMIEALSDDEREHAARASFKYLWESVTSMGVDSKKLKEDREYYAMEMAMRHLSSKKGNTELAMPKFKSAIQFRKEMDLDGLRLCFHADKLVLDEGTRQRYALYREKLEDRMTTGRVYVCGYDKCGRAIYTIYAARTKDFDPEWFLKESLYNFERALACTERESGGVEQSINVIGNYTGFLSKHAAPMAISHEFMNCLRQNYPSRVKRVYLLNTPTSFLFFWSILKPFIGTDTRKKISFISSDRQRESSFGELISIDQAAPWMLNGGQKKRDFDAMEYLQRTPFDEAFD
jgi:CRAL/TRIO domain